MNLFNLNTSRHFYTNWHVIWTSRRIVYLCKQKTGMRIFIFTIFYFTFYLTFAQPGSLNTQFASGGILQYSVSDGTDYATAVTANQNGDLYVAGTKEAGYDTGKEIFIAKFNQTGVLDNQFGTNGIVSIKLFHYITIIKIILQSDNKIIVGGYGNDKDKTSEVFFIRLNADGKRDMQFGDNGIAVSTFTKLFPANKDVYQLYDFDIDFYNNIVGVGSSNGNNLGNLIITKFKSDGRLDVNFGYGGHYINRFPIGDPLDVDSKDKCKATTIIALADGTYLIGGDAVPKNNPNPTNNFIIQKINNNGTADSAFSYGRAVQQGFEDAFDDLKDIMLDAKGNYILCGTTTSNSNDDFGAMLINKKGYLDYSYFGDISKKYGPTGKIKLEFAKKSNETLRCSIMQPDGKFLLIGVGTDHNILVARYNADGQLDTDFGDEGTIEYKHPDITANDYFDIHDATLDNLGNLIIAGWSSKSGADTKANVFLISFKLL